MKKFKVIVELISLEVDEVEANNSKEAIDKHIKSLVECGKVNNNVSFKVMDVIEADLVR